MGSGDRAVDPKRPPRRWAPRVHRGSQVVCVAGLALALGLAYRYGRAHGAVDPAHTGGLIPILLALLAFFLALAVALFRPERGQVRGLVLTAVAWTVALALALAAVWDRADRAVRAVRAEAGAGTPVLNQADVDAYLARHPAPATAGGPGPYRVPTGVFLESAEFLGPNSVRVAGYVWQKYGPAIPGDVARGVVLPEAADGADQPDQAYAFALGDGTEVVGWRFRATLRQAFDYHRYPFDRQDVRLRLWPQDLDPRVLPVPDFASYPDPDPAALPGIDPRFVRGGWAPEHAHFAYAAVRYNTTFGGGPAAPRGPFPELSFGVGLKREFLEPFIDYVVFSLVVALLLFGVLLLTRRDEESRTRFGISTFGVLGSAGTLLFAVLLRHTQLRGAIAPEQIVYLEALPFLLYLAILLVALNAILLASPLRLRLLEYRDNLLPVLLYWPALLGLLLAVTLAAFYR